MANFLVIVDRDQERKNKFIDTIKPLISPLSGLIVDSCTSGDFTAIWAANKNAPINYTINQQDLGIIWGEAILLNKNTRNNAINLIESARNEQYNNLPVCDGFYAGLVYNPDFGLILTTDILGIFPVYYYQSKDIILIASSPALFKYHPLFKMKFNPTGLVGILIANCLIDGETLWQNVHRLNHGHILKCKLDKLPQEIKQYQWRNDNYDHLSFEEQIEMLDQGISQAIARHVNTENTCLMLSGGLDSRMLAGFLVEQGIKLKTMTVGRKSDIEMQCASKVAKTLNFPHYITEIDEKKYPLSANLIIKWEHLSNSFDGVFGLGWDMYEPLSEIATRIITGFSLDHVIGGKSNYDIPINKLSFNTVFSGCINRGGFSPNILEKLLNKQIFGDTVKEIITKIKRIYDGYSDREYRKNWWFDIYHRQRFLIGSSLGWQMSFSGWSTIILNDWELMNICAGLSTETIGERRGQNHLVATKFKQLAELPLDRNSIHSEPLLLNEIVKKFPKILGFKRKWLKLQQKLGYEPRHYYRLFDMNNSGWKLIRKEADLCRDKIADLVDMDMFNQILPKSNQKIDLADTIVDSSKLKMLVGLLLWSEENL